MSEVGSDWSKLCSDLLRSIFEGLISRDFCRARTVCSNWYSVSATCVRPVYPWRISLDENSTLLFDPGEDDIHEIGHPELNLFKIKKNVMAICSNWLLIRGVSLYLQNVFTREWINLPSIKSSLPVGQYLTFKNSASCLWINERTRDYVVACCSNQGYLFSCRKGDGSWWCHQGIECGHVTYKDEKLYVYTFDRCIKILDLSGDMPKEVVQANPYHNHPFHIDGSHPMRVVITSSGEVLIVVSFEGLTNGIFDKMLKRSFYIYKMNLENGNWERTDSLGGEMLIFGQGVTIKAPIKDINGWGIKRDSICFGNSICFGDDDLFPCSARFRGTSSNCGVFDLATSTYTSLDVPFSNSFWFVPGYA